MKNVYFKDVPIYGDLEIDYIVVEDTYPVLFVLKNGKNDRFICVCCEVRDEQRWIINSITCEDLIKLLTDKITLADVFKINDFVKIVAIRNYSTKIETYYSTPPKSLDERDLPMPGVYLEAEPGEHNQYIELLENVICDDFSSVNDSTSKVTISARGLYVNVQTTVKTTVKNSYIINEDKNFQFTPEIATPIAA